jgi:hypothetical protein
MTIRPLSRLAILASIAFLPLAAMTLPAHAASSDAAMLQSYVGSYTGTGTLTGTSSTAQRVKCRLTMQSSAAGKLDYAGRCSAGGVSFSLTGVIAARGGKFTAAMSGSGGGMSGSGTVTGARRGNGVAFNAKTRDTKAGHDRSISSSFALAGGGIHFDFSMRDNKTGKTSTGAIAFSKGGQ